MARSSCACRAVSWPSGAPPRDHTTRDLCLWCQPVTGVTVRLCAGAAVPVEERPGRRDIPCGEPRGPFLRNFLALQAAFGVLLLIASINEPLSDYNRAPTATQMAVVATVWVLTDLVVVAVQVLRARAQRAHR